MVKGLGILLQLVFFFTSSAIAKCHPHQPAIAIQSNQTDRSCSYTVIIKTSCSSVSSTTDKLSISFGDAYGNEVYASRIDDPDTRTFERCSNYVFQIQGPCMDVICYLYFLRNGSDGWKPESTKIYGSGLKTIKFYLDTFLPDGLWFGTTSCIGISISAILHFALF